MSRMSGWLSLRRESQRSTLPTQRLVPEGRSSSTTPVRIRDAEDGQSYFDAWAGPPAVPPASSITEGNVKVALAADSFDTNVHLKGPPDVSQLRRSPAYAHARAAWQKRNVQSRKASSASSWVDLEQDSFSLEEKIPVTPNDSSTTAVRKMKGQTGAIPSYVFVDQSTATSSLVEAGVGISDTQPALTPNNSPPAARKAAGLLNSDGNTNWQKMRSRKSISRQQLQPKPTVEMPSASNRRSLFDLTEEGDTLAPKSIERRACPSSGQQQSHSTPPPIPIGVPSSCKEVAVPARRQRSARKSIQPVIQQSPRQSPPMRKSAAPVEKKTATVTGLRSRKRTSSNIRKRTRDRSQSVEKPTVAAKRHRSTPLYWAPSGVSRSQQKSTPTARPRSLTKSASTPKRSRSKQRESAVKEESARGLEEGAAVYAEWTPDNWHYGRITKRYVPKGTTKPLFDVDFNDGDKRTGMEPKMLQLVNECSPNTSSEVQPRRKDVFFKEADRRGLRKWAAVCAEWTPDDWYYGKIVSRYVPQGKTKPLFDVVFDDGDRRSGLGLTKLRTIEEYTAQLKRSAAKPSDTKTQPVIVEEATIELGKGLSQDSAALNMQQLFENRCKDCLMCNKAKACGKCDVCIENQNDTGLKRKACYFQMCSKYWPAEKGQPVPGMAGWRFYIDTPTKLAEPLRKAPLPGLEGLCVFLGEKAFGSIESALEASGRTDVAEVRDEFYTKKLGLSEFQKDEQHHCLVGRGYHAQWIDHLGQASEIRGEITHCKQSSFAGSTTRQFTVKYSDDLSRINMLHGVINPQDAKVKRDTCELCEADAWSGALSFHNAESSSSVNPPAFIDYKPKHMISWSVPSVRRKEVIPESRYFALVFSYGNYEIRLEPRESEIKGSGLGLFASCQWLGPQNTKKPFLLNPGELIDIGPYGPLLASDLKKEAVSLFKDFILEHKPEKWHFESTSQDGFVIDITDDGTGELHQKAFENPVVYANECDQGAIPSLSAHSDPTGAVHYMMGHVHPDEGKFRLVPSEAETRTWQELLINYGDQFEKVRVRENYSCLPKKEQDRIKDSLLREDEEAVKQFGQYCANDIKDCIQYVEENRDALSEKFPERTLLGVMALLQRLQAMHKEFDGIDLRHLAPDSFCDNGYTDLVLHTTARGSDWESRAKRLLLHFSRGYEKEEDLHQALFGGFPGIMKTLGYDSRQSPEELRKAVEALASF